MARPAPAAAAILAIVASLVVAPGAARATAPTVTGRPCAFVSSDDPTGPITAASWQAGETDGGPYVASDTGVSLAFPSTVTLACSIQVSGTGHPSDPDAAVAYASGSGAAFLPPTAIEYLTSGVDLVWLCTEVVVDARDTYTRYYLDDVSGEMTTDPGAAVCDLATYTEIPPRETCDLAPVVCALPVARLF